MLLIHLKSLLSFQFYHRLVQLNRWYTAGFVLYLFLLSIIILFFYMGAQLHTYLPVFLKNFPQVTFSNGVLTQPTSAVSAPIPNTDFKIVFDAQAKVPPSSEELIKNNTIAWVHNNQIYVPSNTGLQIQQLPKNLNFTSDQPTLQKHQKTLLFSLRITSLIISIFFVGVLLVYSYILALAVCLFFNFLRGWPLSRRTLIKLSAFLLGPLTTLFLIRLWVPIPLFSLAQVVLCIIYTQQIFNTIPENA